MNHRVVFSPEAEEQLVALYGFIAEKASPDVAAGYAEGIVRFCEGLRSFPHRGTVRDDVRPGLRITNYKKRVVVAFVVQAEQVRILGVFYGGQDHEAMLRDAAEDGSRQ